MASDKIKLEGSISDRLGTLQKKMGKGIGNFGGKYVELERVPTGLFQLDLALGGGFPRGKITTIFGKESSNKTNIALLAIKFHQALWPDLICIFLDLENSFDPVWATKMGVNVEKLAVIKPDYAEQAVDIVEGLLEAPDCGLLVIDSLAAFVSYNESESSAEKALVGGSALLVGKMMRKMVHVQNKVLKEGRTPTVICINQTREKVGVLYGSKVTEPGGNAPKFFSTIRLSVYGTNVIDKKVHAVLPVIKHVVCHNTKWKVPITNPDCEFDMATFAYKHLQIGESDDWNAVATRLKEYGLLAKGGTPSKPVWTMLGEEYAKLADCQAKYENDKLFANMVRKGMIEKLLSENDAFIGAQAEPEKEPEDV